jgi:hypothetical protein
MQRHVPVDVGRSTVDVRPRVEEKPHALEVVLSDRHVQRAPSCFVGGVGVGAESEKELGHVRLALVQRRVQRLLPDRVAWKLPVQIAAVDVKEPTDDGQVAAEASVDESALERVEPGGRRVILHLEGAPARDATEAHASERRRWHAVRGTARAQHENGEQQAQRCGARPVPVWWREPKRSAGCVRGRGAFEHACAQQQVDLGQPPMGTCV